MPVFGFGWAYYSHVPKKTEILAKIYLKWACEFGINKIVKSVGYSPKKELKTILSGEAGKAGESLCLEDGSITFRLAIRIGILKEGGRAESYITKSCAWQAHKEVRVHVF